MIQETDDETSLGGAPSALLADAIHLRKAGEYGRVRALLERENLAADEGAAMLYVWALDHLDDHAALQATIWGMIKALDRARQPSDHYLAILLRWAERACLPSAAIDEVLGFVRICDPRTGVLDLAYNAVRWRRGFRQRQAPRAYGVTMVSLGLNCLNWALPNRFGLRTTSQFVDDYNPFCQALHRVAGVVNALATDFASYMASDEIMSVKSAMGHPVSMRRDRTAIWNHNDGPLWVRNDWRELRANLQMKIDNFRRGCRLEDPVFVMGNCLDDHVEIHATFLPRLKESLRVMTGRENNKLIISNQRAHAPGQSVVHVDEYTSFFYCPFPEKDYIWFKPASVDSPVGLEFERAYVRFLFTCLRRWDLLDHAAALR